MAMMGEGIKLKSLMSPSTDIIRTKPGMIEVMLRGLSVGLPLILVIAASSCKGCLGDFVGSLVSQTNSSSSLIISLSYTVILYQLFAIVQLFLRVKIAYTIILRWSLFYLVDLVMILITVFGYLYAALLMSIYTIRWSHLADMDADAGSISIATGVTTALSFLALLLFVGLIVYFYLARCNYRWPTHGELSVLD